MLLGRGRSSKGMAAEDLGRAADVIREEVRQREADGRSTNNSVSNTDKTHGAEVGSGIITADDIRQLDNGELADLERLVWIAEYLATIHANRREMRAMITPLVTLIRDSAESIDVIGDDVQEMLVSAETALGSLKDVHTSMMCGGGSEAPGQGAASKQTAAAKNPCGDLGCITPNLTDVEIQ